MSAVDLSKVAKSFGAARVVHDIDLSVEAGMVVALLGPSGCGKTTTLRLIAGFEVPDEGLVHIDGRLVAGPGGHPFVEPQERRVGMVFQQLALFPHLDVAGNVGYGVRGDRGAKRARVAELLELVELTGMEKRYPDELSGGQAQRVALARALAPRPAVVLLDEPFSSLDVSLRGEVRTEVRRILRDAGATAVLVTHDQDEALAMGDRVAVMLEGRIAQVGAPEHIYRHPASPEVAAFLGDANLVVGTSRGGTLESALGPLPLVHGPAIDGPAVGLVRPEDLDLLAAQGGRFVVEDVEYYGHDQLITVAEFAGGPLVLRARLHARHKFEPGTRVDVTVGGLGVIAFAAS